MAWDRPGRAEGSRTHGYVVEVLRGRSASRQAVLKSCRFPADLPCVMARLWPGRQIVQVSNVFNIWRLQDSLDYEKYLQAFTNVWFGRRKTSNTPELFRGSGVMLTVPFHSQKAPFRGLGVWSPICEA